MERAWRSADYDACIHELQYGNAKKVEFRWDYQTLEINWTEFCDAIASCGERARLGFFLRGASDAVKSQIVDKLPQFLEAVTANSRITGIHFSYLPLSGEPGLVLAEWLRQNPQINLIFLANCDISSDARVSCAAAALQRSELKSLYFENDPYAEIFSEELISSLSRVRARFPNADLTRGSQEQLHDALIAMGAIFNPSAELALRRAQRKMLDTLTKGDLMSCVHVFEQAQQEITDPEQRRLFQLMIGIMDKYCYLGGVEGFGLLPNDFNSSANQELPKPLLALNDEIQVKYLLAVAPYQEETLQDVCSEIEASFECLAAIDCPSACRDAVEGFFCRHELGMLVCILPAIEIEVESTGPDLGAAGRYDQMGISNGFAVFRHSKSKRIMHCWEGKEWAIGLHVSDSMTKCDNNPDDDDCPPSSPVGRRLRSIFHNASFSVEAATPLERPLQDLVVDFLEKRFANEKYKRLLALKDRLLLIKIGPPKNLARALQKGPKSLKDLSRATLVFDSPALLVLAYFLLEKIVKRMGGAITRLSNLFYSDGKLNTNMKAPPCIHINVQINGWIFEIMLALADFLEIKEQVHKYYEFSRTDSPLDMIMPLFKPSSADCELTSCLAVDAHTTVSTMDASAHLASATALEDNERVVTNLRSLCAKFDTRSDGTISKEDLQSIFSMFSSDESSADRSGQLSKLFANEHGRIAYDELLAWLF